MSHIVFASTWIHFRSFFSPNKIRFRFLSVLYWSYCLLSPF